MAIRKTGLGRGLQALLSENSTEDGSATVTLRITEVTPNSGQPRRNFDEAALDELAASVAEHGILQPLLVRPLPDGRYEIVAGERRYRAAKMAGLREIPVVIRELSPAQAATLTLIENLQREDLNPMEEARGFRALTEQYGMTQESAAQAVHKSRPAVTNALRLLSLPPKVAEMVESGALSAGAARALLGAETPEAIEELAEHCVEKGLSVREIEREVAARKASRPSARTRPVSFTVRFSDEVALSLSEQMGRKVRVRPGKKGGVLQVEYFDDDDLRSLAAALGRDG